MKNLIPLPGELVLKVSVVGRGAIGSLLAAMLIKAGCRPVMFWRQDLQENIKVKFQDQSCITITPGDRQIVDLLILPVKAYQVSDALTECEECISPKTCIVLLHNGAGTEDWVLAHFPANAVVRMTTSIAARRINATEILETGKGSTQAGWLRKVTQQQCRAVERLFNEVLSDCEWFDNIQMPIWRKLAVNAVINPLTAINNIQNGELAKPKFDDLKKTLLREFVNIAGSRNLRFDIQELTGIVNNVIALTADNYSSMHQDITHRRKTEVDFINGFLVGIARQNNVEATAHQSLLDQIRTLESGYLLPETKKLDKF